MKITKISLIIPTTFIILFSTFLSNANSISAQTTCKNLGFTIKQDNEDACLEYYDECQSNIYQKDVTGYNNCIDITTGGCNAIGRKADLFDDNCPISVDFDLDYSSEMFQSSENFYEGNLAFCECIVECKKQFIIIRDCQEELSKCCQEKYTSEEKEIVSNTSDEPEEISVIIDNIWGDVEVDIQNTGYKPAKVGMILYEGDYLSTGFESGAVIRIPSIAYLDVGSMTSFAISQLLVEGNLAKTSISLRSGEVTSAIKPEGGKRASFEITTPSATVATRGTKFFISYDEKINVTNIYVVEGVVDVSDENGYNSCELNENQYIAINETGNTDIITNGIPDWYEDLTLDSEVNVNWLNSLFNSKVLIFIVSICCGGLLLVLLLIVIIIFKRRNINKKQG